MMVIKSAKKTYSYDRNYGATCPVALMFVTLALIIAALICASCTPTSSGANPNANDSTEQQEEAAQPAERMEGLPAQRIETSKSEHSGSSDIAEQLNSSDETQTSPSQDSNSGNSASATQLLVRFIDVGQGDCALISCDGMHLLIDGGPPDASSKVYAILKQLNIDYLDYIIATHPDADHIGGISGALNYASCGTCYCSTTVNETKTFSSMNRYLANRGVSLTVPSPGDSFALGNAEITFLGPTQQLDDANNNSLVCRLDYGSTSFLFTGDAELEEEMLLISSDANLKADVLKVAHHGSASSSAMSFLQRVEPKYAVISVGKSNTYGHPTSEVLNDLARLGTTVLRTDEMGSILFRSDGTTLNYTTTKGTIDE